MNQHGAYLSQWSFSLTVNVRTHKHNGQTALPGPLKWSRTGKDMRSKRSVSEDVRDVHVHHK